MGIKFLKRSFFQRLLGISATTKPGIDGCWNFADGKLPFDLNVEAEMLVARVRYHDGFDANPVYPTIADKPFTPGNDIEIPDALAEKELKISKLL